MKQLEEKYDPLTEIVIQGYCKSLAWGCRGFLTPMLQGGSGYLISRFGTQQLASTSEYLIVHGHDCEDQFLAEVLRGMGFSGRAMTSAMFLGATIKRRDRRLFLGKAYQYSQPVLRIVQSGTRAGFFSRQYVTSYFSSDWPRVRRGYQAVSINLVSCAADRPESEGDFSLDCSITIVLSVRQMSKKGMTSKSIVYRQFDSDHEMEIAASSGCPLQPT
jgi:hypothetical protein